MHIISITGYNKDYYVNLLQHKGYKLINYKSKNTDIHIHINHSSVKNIKSDHTINGLLPPLLITESILDFLIQCKVNNYVVIKNLLNLFADF